MPLTIGTRLGPYEITGPLGKGGMGEVYRAKDTKLDREVAIKVLPNSLARDPDRLARFEREAKVLASLNHPNIATIYSLEESPDGKAPSYKAIAMELVDGETLKSPQPLDTALNHAKQIAEALEAAHDRGITHRDLKPANIMVTPAGLVKVLDFGLAAVARPGTSADEDSPTLTMGMTDTGVIMGTAAYMAPEQAVGSPVDRRADIWSFGVVLWQLLTGKPLFTGDTTAHILASVIKDPIDFTKLPTSTPDAIRDLLNRCLDRDVKTRLQVISEARIAIQRYQSNPTPSELPTPNRDRQGAGWPITTALATLAALTLAYVAYQHSTEPTPRLARFSFSPGEKGSLLPLVPPAVSPDGRHIAYAASTDGKNALWMRDVDSATPRKLTDLAVGRPHPFWSPDSRFLAYFDDAKLKKLDVSGGPAIVLCDAVQGRGGSWSSNDVILFSNITLFRVSAAGGTPVPITDVKDAPAETHRYPWFLPDGHHFLYTVRNPDPNKAGIYFADLDAKGRSQISNVASNAVYVAPASLLFVRDQTLMSQPFDAAKGQASGDAVPVADQISHDQQNAVGLFAASAQNGVLAYSTRSGGGGAQITWFDHSGKSLGTVGMPGLIEWASLSPDETTVVENRRDGSATHDLWLHDLARSTTSRLTFAGDNEFPIWSPDGARIAFLHRQDGKSGIATKAANGTGQQESVTDLYQRPTDWSRDGRYILGEAPSGNPKTSNDVWVHPQFGDKKPYPFLQSEFRESGAKLSPDGRWLAYQSNESKRPEVYVVSFPEPGGKWQISTDGGATPVWSRDGRELYFLSLANQIMAVPMKPVGAKLEAGVPKPLFEVRLAGSGNFDVSKDGRFLIPTVGSETSSAPMDVILNWQAALKK